MGLDGHVLLNIELSLQGLRCSWDTKDTYLLVSVPRVSSPAPPPLSLCLSRTAKAPAIGRV